MSISCRHSRSERCIFDDGCEEQNVSLDDVSICFYDNKNVWSDNDRWIVTCNGSNLVSDPQLLVHTCANKVLHVWALCTFVLVNTYFLTWSGQNTQSDDAAMHDLHENASVLHAYGRNLSMRDSLCTNVIMCCRHSRGDFMRNTPCMIMHCDVYIVLQLFSLHLHCISEVVICDYIMLMQKTCISKNDMQ